MQVVHTVADLRATREALGASVGFVPTMGALHEGHLSLIRQSVAENDATIVSVYVNPTQFDNPADLERYPATLAQDVVLAEKAGADMVFAPNYAEMYPDDFHYRLDETDFSRMLCGAHRPGHFTGVLTVVMKLLNIVSPAAAYFGEKDYQQFQLIRGMAAAFFMDVDIKFGPTVREEDGLALSSRNVNLDAQARAQAPLMHALIDSDRSDDEIREQLTTAGFEVDYIVSHDGRRFAAAKLGGVRLIDNVPLGESS